MGTLEYLAIAMFRPQGTPDYRAHPVNSSPGKIRTPDFLFNAFVFAVPLTTSHRTVISQTALHVPVTVSAAVAHVIMLALM